MGARMNIAIADAHPATIIRGRRARALLDDGQRVLRVDVDPNLSTAATLGIES